MPTKTPDLTPAQIISGAAAAVAALVVLFKLDLSDARQAALVTLIGVIVPSAWQIADAIIRHGRSNVAAAQFHAASLQSATQPVRGGAGFPDQPGDPSPGLPHNLNAQRPPA